MGRRVARRHTSIRPRSSSRGPTSKSTGRTAGSVAIRWLGTIEAVRSNQNRERAVRTRPFSGIPGGRTTSNALRRSLATRSNRSVPIAYRSRTLPERMNRSAVSIGHDLSARRPLGRDQGVEAGDDGRHVTEKPAVVETGVQLGEREGPGDDWLERQEVAQRTPFVGGLERDPLHDRVRVVAAEPASNDERGQDARRGMEAKAPLDD